MRNRESAITGCLLGTALGDALGLPYEGLRPGRAERLLGEPDRFRLFFGRGMVSDDTEHACMAAQSLIEAGGDTDRFAKLLSRRMRWWLASLPAGIGLATLRAILKMWLWFPPERCGVCSAGNGPAMRSPVLGAAIDDIDMLKAYVRASTRMTHTDPKAEYGALAIALAARLACDSKPVEPAEYLGRLREFIADSAAGEFLHLVQKVVASVDSQQPLRQFAHGLGCEKGISGYVYHTVPAALHAWLSFPTDYRTAVTEVICCGGDTDTTAAIVGGIVGCTVGKQGLPQDWLQQMGEWPRTMSWIENLAKCVSNTHPAESGVRAPRLSALGIIPRNLVFVAIVLTHGFRRLFPPY